MAWQTNPYTGEYQDMPDDVTPGRQWTNQTPANPDWGGAQPQQYRSNVQNNYTGDTTYSNPVAPASNVNYYDPAGKDYASAFPNKQPNYSGMDGHEGINHGGSGIVSSPYQAPAYNGPSNYEGMMSEAATKASIAADNAQRDRANQQAALNNRRSQYSDLQFNGQANPYTDPNNASRQGMMSQVAGGVGQQLANLTQGTNAAEARANINHGSGFAANMTNQNNQFAAQAQSQGMNQANLQNFNSGVAFDTNQDAARNAFNFTKAGAMENNDFNTLDHLRTLGNDQYTQARQVPLDQLNLRQGYLNYGQDDQLFPGQLAQQGYQTQNMGYQTQLAGGTLGSSIDARNASNNAGAFNDNFNTEQGKYWGSGPRLQQSQAIRQGQMDMAPVANFLDAFGKPIASAIGAGAKAFAGGY